MATSEALKRAQKKYMKAHRDQFRFINLKLNRETDKDVIEKLDSESNIQGYLKALVRKDLKENSGKDG